jgi:hypothetical protein
LWFLFIAGIITLAILLFMQAQENGFSLFGE